MKRVWQLGSLAVLALLVVQPPMAAFACSTVAGASADCAACPSSVDPMGDCLQIMATIIQGQTSCCQVNVPDSTAQVLVDRVTGDQEIGNVVVEQRLAMPAPPTLQVLELDHGHAVPLPAASLQSVYCTFLI